MQAALLPRNNIPNKATERQCLDSFARFSYPVFQLTTLIGIEQIKSLNILISVDLLFSPSAIQVSIQGDEQSYCSSN